jgi:hypothetical protein
MSFKTAEVTLSAAVVTSGTITVPYPANTNKGTFTGGTKHKMWSAGHQAMYSAPTGITVSFGASNITVTYLGSTALPQDSRCNFQFDTLGANSDDVEADLSTVHNVAKTDSLAYIISLGAPITADADGISASATVTAPANAVIGGALASGGVATFDVPRNVVGAWTNSTTVTVTGTDEYGNVIVETSGSGTSMAGKKAFKTITQITPAATITGATFGSGDVLGLPVALPGTGLIIAEMESLAKATAGTPVAAVASVATATTGDVRGTYDPNSACDGSKSFQLIVVLDNPTDKGVAQFGG